LNIDSLSQDDVVVAVRHGLHVVVLEVHGTGPEEEVDRLDDIQDLLVNVQQGHVAAAAACAPVDSDL
jgi:hypothetical protein